MGRGSGRVGRGMGRAGLGSDISNPKSSGFLKPTIKKAIVIIKSGKNGQYYPDTMVVLVAARLKSQR